MGKLSGFIIGNGDGNALASNEMEMESVVDGSFVAHYLFIMAKQFSYGLGGCYVGSRYLIL